MLITLRNIKAYVTRCQILGLCVTMDRIFSYFSVVLCFIKRERDRERDYLIWPVTAVPGGGTMIVFEVMSLSIADMKE